METDPHELLDVDLDFKSLLVAPLFDQSFLLAQLFSVFRLDLFNLFPELILELSCLLGIPLLLSQCDLQVHALLQILAHFELRLGLFVHQLLHLTLSGVH